MPSERKSSRKPRSKSSRSNQRGHDQQCHTLPQVTERPVIEAMRTAIDAITQLWNIANDPRSVWRAKHLLTSEAIDVEISCIQTLRRFDGLPEIPKSELKAQAIASIKERQKTTDAEFELKQRDAELAKHYLGDIAKIAKDRNALVRILGRPDDGKTTRKMLDVLGALGTGEPLFNIAVELAKEPSTGTVPEGSAEKKQRVLLTELKRFCSDVDCALRKHFFRLDGKTYAFCTPQRITDGMIMNTFKSWPGVEFPRDIPAFREAVERNARSQGRNTHK